MWQSFSYSLSLRIKTIAILSNVPISYNIISAIPETKKKSLPSILFDAMKRKTVDLFIHIHIFLHLYLFTFLLEKKLFPVTLSQWWNEKIALFRFSFPNRRTSMKIEMYGQNRKKSPIFIYIVAFILVLICFHVKFGVAFILSFFFFVSFVLIDFWVEYSIYSHQSIRLKWNVTK